MIRTFASRLLKVEPREVAALAWSCAYFFCLLSGWYILRPIRDDAGAAGGVNNIRWLYLATFTVSLIAGTAFGAVVSRLPRRRFIPIAYRFFAATLIAFWGLYAWLPPSSHVNLGRAFYVWTSVYNLFVISVFWSFMADVFTNEQGKRLFAFIAVGGTLGAIAGSSFVSWVTTPHPKVASHHLILLTVALLEASCWCVQSLGARAARRAAMPQQLDAEARPIGGHALSGLVDVARSPYLAGICGFMLFYTVTSTFLEVAKLALGAVHSTDRSARIGFFADIDFWTNVATLLAQLFLTGRIMSRFGVAITIAILPVVTILGFVALSWALLRPGLLAAAPLLTAFIAVRKAANYAVTRPAREVLFTVVSRDERFKAKNLIDVAIYRFGDQLGVWSDWVLRRMFAGGGALGAMAAIPVAVAWLVLGLELGRAQRERATSIGSHG